MSRRPGVCAVVTALAFWIAPLHAQEPVFCPSVSLPPIALPHLRDALKKHEPATVIAFGSSSTEGIQASDKQHAYPAVLQADLRQAMPEAKINVLNRGIGGQDSSEMLARLQKDVLDEKPAVVIWQVGANGAMRKTDPTVFQAEVDRGVRQLNAEGMDVVLMDNQRSPNILASPFHAKIDQAMADVARRDGARLFARGRLMEMWQESGHPYREFLANDGIHHNDRGYACVAHALASTILTGLGVTQSALHASQ